LGLKLQLFFSHFQRPRWECVAAFLRLLHPSLYELLVCKREKREKYLCHILLRDRWRLTPILYSSFGLFLLKIFKMLILLS
jgi:hypothetical protein